MRTREEIHSSEWFGTIPDGWEMKPLKALFTFSKGLTVTKADLIETGSRVINYGQVHSKMNTGTKVTPDLIRCVSPDKVPANARIAKAGSFIFACTSEDLQGCGDCIYLDSETDSHAGGDTILLTPNDGTDDNKYLAYQFLTDEWRYQLRRDLVDVKVYHVNGSNLKEAYVVLPPREVRCAIVSYLDARCTPIDEAIARHRAVIGKLEEYRRAVITKTVTKGLDPDAPMKDSGIGWIGMMPEKWRLEKLKYLCRSRNGLDYNAQDVCDPSDRNAVFVVRSSNINDGRLEHGDDVYINKIIPDVLRLHRGDLVIVRTNGSQRLVGKCALVETDEYCTAGAFMLVCRSECNPFIYWVLRSKLLDFHRGQFDTTTINQLSNDMLRNMLVPLPPAAEMLTIMAYLDYQCAAVDDAIDRQNRIIDKLEEYRRSLIHAAVTGRIDCTKETL